MLRSKSSLNPCNKRIPKEDHGLKKVLKVSLPLVTPTILAGGAIVFLRAFADYGTPRLIGEGFTTMPVLIQHAPCYP